ncbi:hypothetical protein BJY52DRAFT_199217 [Lactarius psammicola]|nr:hypothetical protein BJY52DRAFT_199217 [Lactarius psammicola]
MAQICIHVSAFLFNVKDLHVGVTQPSSLRDREAWLKLFQQFGGTKRLHVAGEHSTYVVRALQQPDRWRKTVLPALHKLYIPQPWPRHASLREAVVSFMTSCRLSGHPIAVEYEQLRHIRELRETAGRFSRQGTIEMLSEDILLNIFLHILDASPKIWPTLVHVSQRWRQIIFTSPLGLDLRLYCTYGTPVLKTLDCWPALPIVVQYGGLLNLDPPAPKDDDNIIAALKQSSRVGSISLTVTGSLLEKLSAITEPFLELEALDLLSRDNTQLTLPSTFRWGARLRTLHSTKIAVPALPQLLSPSTGLVDLQLHEIPSVGYFSPEAFANALSVMIHLRSLSLHFLSLPPRRNYLSLPPPPGERVVLPALTSLKYRGTSKYLDVFVARIDAPRLIDIDITFFSQPTMDTSQLGRFVERIEMRTSLSQADVETSGHAISIFFTNPSTSTPLRLQISCKTLDWQLSSMAQVCDQFSPFLFRVKKLGIDTTQSSSGQDDVDGEGWLELIRAFGGATDFSVAGELTTDILCALRPVDGGHTTVLPDLRDLQVEEPMAMHGPSWDAVQSFITSRTLSGRSVQVYLREYSCHVCDASFGQQQGLNSHLGDQHAYRIVCSYCSDVECKPGHNHLFGEHLKSKHSEVARNDALITKPLLTPFELDNLIIRHSSLRAPDLS